MMANLQPVNFADYTVLVTNAGGSVLSATARLSIAVSPMIVSPNFNSGSFRLTFPTELGPTYEVEYKQDLNAPSWQLLTNVIGTGSPLTITNSSGTSATKFYRIKVR